MSVDFSVPFYSNTIDDTHCWQAAIKMVLKYFEPAKEFNWEELDVLTDKKPNLWSWPSAGLLHLSNIGYEIKIIEAFDYKRFSQEGSKYIYSEFGNEVGRSQEEHADIQQGMSLAGNLIKKGLCTNQIPQIKDILNFLDNGYIVICNINSAKLNNKDGYVGHFVVVKGYKDTQIILHDPGLPPLENRLIDFNSFQLAWAFPNDTAKNIKAVKLK